MAIYHIPKRQPATLRAKKVTTMSCKATIVYWAEGHTSSCLGKMRVQEGNVTTMSLPTQISELVLRES